MSLRRQITLLISVREGGDGGGTVVAKGTPEEVAKNPASHTGRYVAKISQIILFPIGTFLFIMVRRKISE